MISFLLSIVVLIIGYFVYGKFIEKVFSVDKDRQAAAIRLRDDVDFVPLPTWKIFLIQFLNIAGLGPIFGAIAGAMFCRIFMDRVGQYFRGDCTRLFFRDALP